MKAGSEIVTDAIKNGDSAKAVEALDDKINRVMNRTWTCHPRAKPFLESDIK